MCVSIWSTRLKLQRGRCLIIIEIVMGTHILVKALSESLTHWVTFINCLEDI